MSHPGELTLRRVLAGELSEPHLAGCGACQQRLTALREEQRRFEAELPFERFAAGVEKAARQQRRAPRPAWGALLAVAAALVAVVGARWAAPAEGPTRLKGGSAAQFVVAGAEGQREAAAEERLAPGERIRVGVSGHRHVLALSIDEAGVVTPVYASGAGSLSLPDARQAWLPDSLELTGAGLERLVVVLSDAPLAVEAVSRALLARYQSAGGDLRRLEALDVPGDQFHRTFVKP